MQYLLLSFIAGVLTILAPCVIPTLPLVLGGSLTETSNKWRPLVIVLSLSVSILIFSILLKASTVLIVIDPRFWNILSGVIIFLFGIFTLFPDLWGKIEIKLKLNNLSGNLLQNSSRQSGLGGAILIGASLGPVFTSCSPTYALIVAVILPQNFAVGILNLISYVIGIMLIFGAIAIGGRQLLSRIKWIANPQGIFKKVLGIIFVILGILIITGLEKKLESALLDLGFADGLITFESDLYEKINR